MKTMLIRILAALSLAASAPLAVAQTTAFTYQGRLESGGVPATGATDLTFTLYDAASGGATVGASNVVNDLFTSNGFFTVTLDFGSGAFNGAARWLQIAVRPGASTGGYTNLAPRTAITATPYAMHAGGATASGLIGSLPASALTGVNGGGLININATNLAGTVPTARLSTNVALRAGGNTFGGNQAFSDGNLSLAGTSTFEFGAGVAGKQISAGMIGYESFTPGALDIIGAGITPIERRVQLWDQVHVGNFDADEKPRLISFGDGEFVSIGENGADDRMELTAGAFVFKNGPVGIGTDSPSAKLDVVGNIIASGRVGIGTNNPATKLTVYETTYGIEHTDGIRRLATYIDASGCYFGTASTDPLLFYVNDGAANMVVNTNGRVGIGTLAPVSQLEVAGTVTASGFSGDGSGLTGIGASNLTGNLPDSSLSANVARRDEANIFSGDQRINNGSLNVPNGQISVGGALLVGGSVTANSLSGNGGGLTGIAAGNISGTLGAAQIPNLDAAKIASGTLADARLSANVALRSGGNTFTGNQIITGGNLGIGTVNPATTLEVRSATPAITVGTASDTSGALYFGNPGHGVKRAYNGNNDVGLYTTAADLYLSAQGTSTNQFVLKNNGRVGLGTNAPATKLHVVGSGDTELSIQSADNNRRWTLQASGGPDGNPAFLGGYFQIIDRTAGASRLLIETNGNVTIPAELTTTAINLTSDRNVKEQFKPVNAREVLAKVARLPISEWQYKSQADARHIGPMAQDFREAFSLGHDEKHITSVDADGVALAAIQGLNEKLEEQTRVKDARIQQLEATVEELKALVSKLAAQQNGGGR